MTDRRGKLLPELSPEAQRILAEIRQVHWVDAGPAWSRLEDELGAVPNTVTVAGTGDGETHVSWRPA